MTYVGIMLAGIAAIAMTVPAAASLTSTHTRPVQPTVVQYAQDFSHGSRAVDYGYKSKKKSAKSTKKSTTGSAKSTDTAK